MRGLALTALTLAGCATAPHAPKVVTVVSERIVPVPERLTRPCAVYHAQSQTVGEAIKGQNTNVANLDECNARMAEIRKLGEKGRP